MGAPANTNPGDPQVARCVPAGRILRTLNRRACSAGRTENARAAGNTAGVRKLLVFLLIVVLLVVGADIAGRVIAQNEAATAISRQSGTATIGRTTVAIHGFSFLAQAVPGRYQHITLTASDLTVGPVVGIAATIELYDGQFPLSDALQGNTDNLVTERATLRGEQATSAVTAAIPQSSAAISAGANGSIQVTAPVSISGRSITVTADLLPSFSAGVLRLNAMNVRAAGIPLPDVDALTRNLSVALPLDQLPFAVDGATVTSSGSNLVLTATAYNARLRATS